MSNILLGFSVAVYGRVQPTVFQCFLHWPWVISSQACNGTFLWISGALSLSVCLPPARPSPVLCSVYSTEKELNSNLCPLHSSENCGIHLGSPFLHCHMDTVSRQ